MTESMESSTTEAGRFKMPGCVSSTDDSSKDASAAYDGADGSSPELLAGGGEGLGRQGRDMDLNEDRSHFHGFLLLPLLSFLFSSFLLLLAGCRRWGRHGHGFGV